MRRPPTPWRRQRGSIHFIYLSTLPLIFGLMGLLVDLSQVQARKAELQVIVDAAALAAAKSLQLAPNNYAAATTAASQAINYHKFRIDNANLVALPAATITFGAGKAGPTWLSAAAAGGSGHRFAKVDSLDAAGADFGKVDTMMIHVLDLFKPGTDGPATPIQLVVSANAVAGPLGVNVGLHQ